MNIQYIKLGLLATLFVGGTALFTSCADDLDVGTQFDKEMYNGVYENNAYLRDGKSNKVSNIVELYGEIYQTSVKLGLSKAPVTETSARVKIDAAYLAAYNKVHGTEFELYPENLISFANEGKLVVNAAAKSAEVNMAIQAGEALQEDKTYAIPVVISEHSNDLVVNDENGSCIYLVKDMRKAGDAYKGDDVVQGYLFFEVNDVNPLNALSFKLENGRFLWDVVVLFAANINYDADAGRPKVQCNPNVQYLLDNNETFLQPLRRRGIKVLLGILGNGDMTGVAQLSTQGAKDFARELAQYCKVYNLDGVNYDDEYSKSPDLDNPALTNRSSAAAARLCYETKQAMPDKLVTVFDYSYMGIHGYPTEIEGKTIKEWVDISVPNYGSSSSPAGDMTMKQCAGLAMEFNGGWNSLSASTAQGLKERGYGWFMGFAANPKLYGDIFSRLSGGGTVLYGSEVAAPTVFYKKNDPTPYKYPDDFK